MYVNVSFSVFYTSYLSAVVVYAIVPFPELRV